MNRIEQFAALTPAQQPRLPRALTDVRRRAAHALLQPREAAGRTRRGTTGLAVAIAALAVPVLPGAAFGAASQAGSGAVKAKVPLARHHLHHRLHHSQVVPEPGTVTVEKWEASGLTLTVPYRPADMGLLGRVMHDRHYSPWRGQAPHADGSATSPWQAPSDGAMLRAARSRDVSTPLIPTTRPANTKQMLLPGRFGTDVPESGVTRPSAPSQALAAARPSMAPCMDAASAPDLDRGMVARLRPTADPMNVVVPHPRPACGPRVDYLSQARA